MWVSFVAALALGLAGLAGCADEPVELEAVAEGATSRADAVVSEGLARAIAEADLFDDGVGRRVRAGSVMEDAAGRPALYAFDFVEGGFVVIAADFEVAPVLAFAEEGALELDALVPGAEQWAAAMRRTIEEVRGRSEADDAATKQRVAIALAERDGWVPLLARLAGRAGVDAAEVARGNAVVQAGAPPLVEPCESYVPVVHGPLVAARWDQTCGFNQRTPAKVNQTYCNHAPVGCGPVAMGQIVQKHRHAAGHSYATWNMPAGVGTSTDPGVDARARLLSDLGGASSTTYDVWFSSTTLSGVRTALESFGYTATLGTPPTAFRNIVMPEILAGRPLIIAAQDASSEGHMWVLDGYKGKQGVPAGCKPTQASTVKYFSYNWGWGGAQNGWYKEGDFGAFPVQPRYFIVRPS